ncbi:unnamed protein product, partial [Medioppia subpectinata]
MHYYRVLLSVTHLRTPVLVSLSMVGANRWRRHNRTDDRPLAADLQPKYLFGSLGTGWPAVSGLRQARMEEPSGLIRQAFKGLVAVEQRVYEGAVPETAPTAEPAKPYKILSTGTGFIVKTDRMNYVVTTARAVGNAKYVIVGTADSNKCAWCHVRYREPELDMALVECPDIQAVQPMDFVADKVIQDLLPTRDVLQVYSGQYNIATAGVVSCANRTGAQITKIGKKYGFITPKTSYIQHTANIPFDSYGGPLLDAVDGKVLGMSFYLQLVDNVTLYFAIPSNEIR